MTTPWDNNAPKRHKQILDGLDFSFDHILLPTFVRLVKGTKDSTKMNALDVGCGSGILTEKISIHLKNVVGIDPSEKSIEIAKSEYRNIQNLKFLCKSITNYRPNHKYDLVISNMTVQTIKNVKKAFISISALMNGKGTFIFSIPHPCFWIEYRKKIGLDEYQNFTYGKNLTYLITFSISNDRTPLPSHVPFYHRNLQYYAEALEGAGFLISRLLEPFPKNIKDIGKNWETPHFLFFVCRKSN